jgi:flavin-dependent dehydrogenase
LRQNANLDVDVTVLGGGPAGAATALALRRHGYSSVVIERSDYASVRIGETLSPAVRPILSRLGVWETFRSDRHLPSFGIHSVWGAADIYDNEFIFSPYGPGWHIDRAGFDAMLARCAEEAGASVYRGAGLLSCTTDDTGHWRTEFACEDVKSSIRSKFIVDATGRASSVARRQGAGRISFDRLVGLVGFFSSSSREKVSDSFTLVEAVEDGWWYSAMLPDLRVVVAFMTDADLYKKASKALPYYWQLQLRRTIHTRSRIPRGGQAPHPVVVAANSSRLNRSVGKNWLAVGDAASTFDPLSAQGVQKAMESGLRAAHSINDHWSGDDSALQDYARDVDHRFDSYLQLRQAYYAQEKRWPDSMFWRRRHRPEIQRTQSD